MPKKWTGLAVDLGASSGRVMGGSFDGKKLEISELHRFENEPVQLPQSLHWDILSLYRDIKTGIRKGAAVAREQGGSVSSLGIDTWAIDFGLLDKQGNLLGNPVHYRDHRTDDMMPKVFSIVPKKEVFSISGIQFLQFNTIFQLAAMRLADSPVLPIADSLLLIPDLLAYFLTGVKANEFTNATTTQLLDASTGQWSNALIEKLKLPRGIFKQIVQPGKVLEKLSPAIGEELGAPGLPLVAVATHDTGSAVAGTPARSERFAYLSCGTWSLLGTEVKTPVLNEKAHELNFTNEGGINGTYRLLKNIMGLWLLQETRREWERGGKGASWEQITKLTAQAPAFRSFIDPDDSRFFAHGDMPKRVRDFCKETGQEIPESDAALLRCITESLAFKYRWVLTRLEELCGSKMAELHMVGGGIQNTLLCKWTAAAIGRPVLAGPAEATALGNLSAQLLAMGEVSSLAQSRELIAKSFAPVVYEPQDSRAWDDAYARFEKVLKR
jgi:rhamnulokinase